MTTLNVAKVLDLATKAVEIRGRDYIAKECVYVRTIEEKDSVTYRAECIVGLMLWNLLGAAAMIKEFSSHVYGVESCSFVQALSMANVSITPNATMLLKLMQQAQDGGGKHDDRKTWGTVLDFAYGAVDSFDLDRNDFAAIPSEHDGRVEWVRNNIIKPFETGSSRIQAIKEARIALNCGLKEAKDAIDEAYPRA